MARLLFEDYLNKINKDNLFIEYITNNKTIKECCNIFNVSQSMLMRILKYYNIRKPKEAHVKNIKKSKLEHFGDPNYNNHSKRTQTNLEKYGVENQFQRKELFPQIAQIKIDRYGTYNNTVKNHATRIANSGSLKASYSKQIETYKQTCLERYNTDNIAKLTQVRQQIAESLKETFLERYGVENYWAMPNAKLSNGSKNSKANQRFYELLAKANIAFEQEFVLKGKRFDFKVQNTLIEINPTATHNSTWGIFETEGLDKNYHKIKTNIAKNENFQCVHIFDWDDPAKVVAMLKAKEVVFGRNCEIKEIPTNEAAEFLTKYHIQGYARDRIRIGLYYDNQLVSLMTFGKPRYNKKYQYELIRYCNSTYNILGGAEKMHKFFIEQYQPESIISYCDLSKFSGQVYEKLGFKRTRTSGAARHWYNLKTKQHITDNLLRQRGFDQLFKTEHGKGTSNEALMLEAGFVEVYDCGQATYIWHKE